MAGGLSLRARRVESAIRSGVVETRFSAADAAAKRIRNELLTLEVRADVETTRLLSAGAEVARAARIASNYARDWLKTATATRSAQAANAAMRSRTAAIAATETSQAYNAGRARYLRALPRQRVTLLKVWDAVLDRHVCPVCSGADGTIVGIREPFPLGSPGDVHPWCRCTETILREDEVNGEALIQLYPEAA